MNQLYKAYLIDSSLGQFLQNQGQVIQKLLFISHLFKPSMVEKSKGEPKVVRKNIKDKEIKK